MGKKIKVYILILVTALTFAGAVIPAFAQTADEQKRCDDFYAKFTYNGINTISGLPKVCSAGALIASIISLLLQFSAMVAVVFLMLGGFWYLTAAGNEEQSEKGRKALTSAIIGLVVIIMAYALVRITANLLTSGIGGGNGGGTTTSTNGGTGGTGGAGGGGGGTGGGAAAGVDEYGLTQEDIASFNNRADNLAPTITYGLVAGGSEGINATANIPASNKQALVELKTRCAGFSPTFGILLGDSQGTKLIYAEVPFQKDTGGNFKATINSTNPVDPAARAIIFTMCGTSNELRIESIGGIR